jgi:hypothetical protein
VLMTTSFISRHIDTELNTFYFTTFGALIAYFFLTFAMLNFLYTTRRISLCIRISTYLHGMSFQLNPMSLYTFPASQFHICHMFPPIRNGIPIRLRHGRCSTVRFRHVQIRPLVRITSCFCLLWQSTGKDEVSSNLVCTV